MRYRQRLFQFACVLLLRIACKFCRLLSSLHRSRLVFIDLIASWVSIRSCCCVTRARQVGGVVETNRPDTKNAQYQACIKQGDLLLNRVQKLGRVVDA